MRNIFERLLSLFGIVIAFPVLILIALAIVIEDGFPFIFRQTRVGLNDVDFEIIKFRTMRLTLSKQENNTISTDKNRRITRVGVWLRKYKLDELLQLINILKGDMAFVGPRPELRKYVNILAPDIRNTLTSARPGITDPASILYRNEGQLLTTVKDPIQYYEMVVLPHKAYISANYLTKRNIYTDFRIIICTIFSDDKYPRTFL